MIPSALTPKLESLREAERAVRKKMFGYIIAGLGLVAGLAWNDGIRAVIDYFVPDTGDTVIAKLLYALVVTLIVGLAVWYLEKSSQKE